MTLISRSGKHTTTFQNQSKMPQMPITTSSEQPEESGTLPRTAMLLLKEARSRSKRAFLLRMLVMQLWMQRAIELCLTVKLVGPTPTKKHSKLFYPLGCCNLDFACSSYDMTDAF